MRPVALTIAGSDSGGGAGITADVKTFEAHGVWATCAVTAVTAQNTTGVRRFAAVDLDLVRAQIDAVIDDIGISAAKTGMLPSARCVEAVADALRESGIDRLVVDPVLTSGHGEPLFDDDTLDALRARLLPAATVVTPNIGEAARLSGVDVVDRATMLAAGRVIADWGPAVVMVKGGHLAGEGSPDLLVARGGDPEALWLEATRLPAINTHGTGCVLSAAITAELARGMEPKDACVAGKKFVEHAIAAGIGLGRGVGPVDPGWARDT